MSTNVASRPATGQPRVLATYRCDEGERELVGQRVDGSVRITDRPHTGDGRSYLLAEEVASMAELEGLVAHYLSHARQLGYAPAQRLPI